MIETGRRPPRLLLVAAAALDSFLAAMGILVAGNALAPQAQKGVIEIFHLDVRPDGARDVLQRVAVLALLLPVLALQSKAGLSTVVKALAVHSHQGECQTVMVHMTACAILLALGGLVHPRMISGSRLQASSNLDMTLQAFEIACTGSKIVAGRALRHAL
jgi:hypothetical protein